MAMFKHRISNLLLTGPLLLAACSYTTGYASNDGNEKPAYVVGHGVSIREVNGISVGSLSRGAKVLPGPNEIKVSIDGGSINLGDPAGGLHTLKITAAPGATYAVSSQRGVGRMCAFLIDQQTGELNYHASAGCAER